MHFAATAMMLAALFTGCVSTPGQNRSGASDFDSVEQSLNEGDLGSALAGVRSPRTTRPDDLQVLKLAARLYLRTGRSSDLREVTERILQLNPADTFALEQLGLIRLASGELEGAENALTVAVALDPSRWMAWNGLGVLADLQADFDTARQRFERSLQIVPGHPKVLANLGWSRLLADDLPEAERLLRSALSVAPESLTTQSNLAFCIALQGRYEEAMNLYESTYAKPVAANNVGYAASLREDQPGARKYLSMALELQPNYYKKAANNLARISP
ncbi:MAG: tetratricopeptide repeat protein [Gammaproteobacteria bacterium]